MESQKRPPSSKISAKFHDSSHKRRFVSLGSEDTRISGESWMGWRLRLSLLSCGERWWCFLPVPSTLARDASESQVKCILSSPEVCGVFQRTPVWPIPVWPSSQWLHLESNPTYGTESHLQAFPWTGNHSECESWHRTVAGTGCRLRDAGNVQPDAGVRVQPAAAAGESSLLSGVDLRDPSGHS